MIYIKMPKKKKKKIKKKKEEEGGVCFCGGLLASRVLAGFFLWGS